ncbi:MULTISPECIES: methionine ABC transporter permease [Aneurinibacillus]|jgi:D-methionine transport system permease protein|uniref:ABC transporter permease n=1 Tax=Aneurinibacillus thermoaerophilus TaxID=143495 RepID=A0A1G7WW93_ANETH|nr:MULTISPECIES: methionine ABC transporter permease [Aneurinibacillus]AMA73925.1 methionine ABC transporter ATP-binding protein [Aneurinibacillus sp. XH2]MED0674109.1 ABC transporter permease [Aneurinibacillus thermoaerophilus]MED0678103.1 ABC transporter permease [Aneurinibacillus thermoaerophilus]MED0737710.1 ABC transporter permease [Aneurinibacillus thermoaerophilus]MED0755702.1 ABC transporter permease [Aneurinibacillus thermoaerophilus]
MFDNVIALLPEIGVSIVETSIMVGISIGSALLLGMPLGVLLFLTGKGQLLESPILFRILSSLVNIVRSFPFLILLVALIPLTRTLVGTTIGPVAAAVPLSIAAIPYFARLVEQSLREVSRGVIEAAVAMGASTYQIVWKVLLTEARAGLTLGLTVLIVSFLSYSAMAGVVGGGGIGDLAIRFGYYRFQTDVMIVTVLLLVVLVQVIQFAGNRLAHYLDKR